MFSFHYLDDAPLIDVANHVQLDGNVNGPALISAPDWLDKPPGKYLLYFAHHQGRSIRLATSDKLTGPWHIHDDNPLKLTQSRFATSAPAYDDMAPEARAYIDAEADGDYPHIASPDIWVDHDSREIRLYYHGRMDNGLQRTRLALSRDAVNFETRDEILGLPYLKIFKHQDWFYALTMPGRLYRSRDGLSSFEEGPVITTEPIRHHALLWQNHHWQLFWTRVGDAPERILLSKLNTTADWQQWTLEKATEVHRPRRAWEGAYMPVEPSRYGGIMHRANQLRDPAIYEEDGKIYLLYTIAGEQGIAIGEIRPRN